jgi:hypothetical protein
MGDKISILEKSGGVNISYRIISGNYKKRVLVLCHDWQAI